MIEHLGRVAGVLLLAVGKVVRFGLIGLIGAVMIGAGAWIIWPPAGMIVSGVLLLMIDKRVTE